MTVFQKTIAVSLSLLLSATAMPVNAFDELDEDIFGVSPVEDEELAEMRGGFSFGGLDFSFALKNRTIVNGAEVNNFVLESANLSEFNTQNLQKVIQVGENNNFESIDALMEIPGLATVILNTENGALIQNFNELDLKVNNFSDFQSNVPLQNAIKTSQSVGLR